MCGDKARPFRGAVIYSTVWRKCQKMRLGTCNNWHAGGANRADWGSEHVGRQKESQTDRQTDRETDKQTDRQTHIPIILARGLMPSWLAFCAVISTRAAAPSFSVLALAAVTVPATPHSRLHNNKLSVGDSLAVISTRAAACHSAYWRWRLSLSLQLILHFNELYVTTSLSCSPIIQHTGVGGYRCPCNTTFNTAF